MCLKSITSCTGCDLYQNQPPLLDNVGIGQIIWVGLSAVQVTCTERETPLGAGTNSGMLINSIEKKNDKVRFYKTNLVKCLPLKDGKIRYPIKQEMKECFNHLLSEFSEIKPKVVFLLGKQVYDFIAKQMKSKTINFDCSFKYKGFLENEITFIPIHHPSYILVYKRKKVETYISSISDLISSPQKALI